MPVGVPVFALGRNPFIAWGGTSLRALACEVVPSELDSLKEGISSGR